MNQYKIGDKIIIKRVGPNFSAPRPDLEEWIIEKRPCTIVGFDTYPNKNQ